MATRITHPGLIDLREVRTLNNDGSYTYYPNVDYIYGPYAATTEKSAKEVAFEALSATTDNIKANALVKGKTVGIIEGGNVVEYWFGSDPADVSVGYQITDLVKKYDGKVPQPTVTVADINQYAHSGGVLPYANVYVYDGIPVSHLRYVDESGNMGSIYFCVQHLDGSEELSNEYIYFTKGEHYTQGFDYVATFDHSTAPDYILRVFGENDATTSYSGRLSATDKYRLDYLWDNYGATATESQTKTIVTDFEPSEEEDESESNN